MPETRMGAARNQRTLDARPDRIDFRDRIFQPSLVCLPHEFPSQELIGDFLEIYARNLILDQGSEGACTGFGLAAAINYLAFDSLARDCIRNQLDLRTEVKKLHRVSPRMLYHLARTYDEWPGEDYEGSSCRGAMKGWHRHGVCNELLWPYRDKRGRVRFLKPADGWQVDAGTRPLGAYYRVEKDSIADLQAAIHEVGAIYVSAQVHDGWMIGKHPKLTPLKMVDGETGGHAFAMVGYNADGFIVQNSWGLDWGFYGFAVMTYDDWVQHGTDAWVSVLGAAMRVVKPGTTFSNHSLIDVTSGKAKWFWKKNRSTSAPRYANPKVEPLDESDAYEHTIVMGNEGRPINRFLHVSDAAEAVTEAAFVNPGKWLAANQSKKLAIFVHGGLNEEATSVMRIRVMAPYFRENGIYPLFITWKTGIMESLHGILDDVVSRFFLGTDKRINQGWFDNLKYQISEARDRTIEVAARDLLIKSVWDQMKQNSAAATTAGGGLRLLATELAKLKKQVPDLEVHLIGHSAGAIVLGHLLDSMTPKKLAVESCTLYAPACTLDFAIRHYGRAHENQILHKKKITCDILSDERERADSIGPYGKSLLYLISRALEEVHKTPLLGMEAAWRETAETTDQWNRTSERSLQDWRRFAANQMTLNVHRADTVSDGREDIPLNHGSFDNNIEVVANTIRRIRGRKLLNDVESLHGF